MILQKFEIPILILHKRIMDVFVYNLPNTKVLRQNKKKYILNIEIYFNNSE